MTLVDDHTPMSGSRLTTMHDADDFATWYRETWPRVVRAATAVTADPERAADAAADAFAKAYQRWDSPARPADPTGWTVVVALNAARRSGRRDVRRRELHLAVDATAAASAPRPPIELATADLDLLHAIRRLPARERHAVALRYAADLTEAEVARAMGITPGAVAATLSSARSKLRLLLTEDDHA